MRVWVLDDRLRYKVVRLLVAEEVYICLFVQFTHREQLQTHKDNGFSDACARPR